ncbi:hypothetical protein FCL40_15945 [Ferrimonas sediminicola]|uniref:Uncharacterized protein n=1 Tax=Ferrimonas sediminicola TaxID=2569538 RepID=A0A4U1B9B2_9GAMM|nr:hypothetical protein [Ferrimonas sediminicola]TKB47340.1 hypothetical protein FCL40_15945 [Ferrimonas sediminicola]
MRYFTFGLMACMLLVGAAQAKQLQPNHPYSWEDKVSSFAEHPEFSRGILPPAVFNNPRAETYKVYQGRFWQCAKSDRNGQCTHVKFVGYEAGGEHKVENTMLAMSPEAYRRTKELIEQMMMELRFRGLEDGHPLVQQALEQGRRMHRMLLVHGQE